MRVCCSPKVPGGCGRDDFRGEDPSSRPLRRSRTVGRGHPGAGVVSGPRLLQESRLHVQCGKDEGVYPTINEDRVWVRVGGWFEVFNSTRVTIDYTSQKDL